MSKHTPGPWIIEPEKRRNTNIMAKVAGSEYVKYVASVEYYMGNKPWNICSIEHKANAKLIAAAPELFLALDQLLRVTVDEDLKHGIGLTEAEQEAREYALAVIAKAIID